MDGLGCWCLKLLCLGVVEELLLRELPFDAWRVVAARTSFLML